MTDSTTVRSGHHLHAHRSSVHGPRPWRRTAAARLLIATFVLTAVCASTPAAADVVRLANGDRLSGQVAELADGKLALATGYAGDVEIEWSRVTALVTDGPVTVETADGRRLRGVASEAGEAPGTLRLRPASAEELAAATEESAEIAHATDVSAPETLSLADVRALNPPPVPGILWRGSLSAAVTSTSGNTESDRLYVAGELVARAEPHRVTFGADVNEASEDGVDTVSRTYGYLRYDRFFGPSWYLNANASATEDRFQDLDLRTTAGLALGHQFSDDDTLRLGAELGVSYVDEDFSTTADDSYAAGRWSLDLSRHLDGGIELFHSQELLVSFENTADRLLRTRTGVRFALWKSFVAALQYNYDRDASPAPGREKADRAWLLNLGYTW